MQKKPIIAVNYLIFTPGTRNKNRHTENNITFVSKTFFVIKRDIYLFKEADSIIPKLIQ